MAFTHATLDRNGALAGRARSAHIRNALRLPPLPGGGLERLAARIRRYFREARAVKELSQLDDRTLRDIGVSRCDIARIVKEPALRWRAGDAPPRPEIDRASLTLVVNRAVAPPAAPIADAPPAERRAS